MNDPDNKICADNVKCVSQILVKSKDWEKTASENKNGNAILDQMRQLQQEKKFSVDQSGNDESDKDESDEDEENDDHKTNYLSSDEVESDASSAEIESFTTLPHDDLRSEVKLMRTRLGETKENLQQLIKTIEKKTRRLRIENEGEKCLRPMTKLTLKYV